jgi:hypothetical protein
MDYPEKTCSIDRLVTHQTLIDATLAGRKTQQRRNGVYAYPNETFTLENTTFIVTDLYRQRLGDMTTEDAQAEGYPNLEMYRDLILKMHQGMAWNEDALVWVHCFKVQD